MSPAVFQHSRLTELFAIDLRTLALFRLLFGSVLFCVVGYGFFDLEAFYTDFGFSPRSWIISVDSYLRLSLYWVDGGTLFTATLLTLQAIAALCLAVGYRTRWATVISFVLWGSLMNRAPLVLIGGDMLMACLLFWSLFLPLGARYSFDAALSTTPPPAENRHLSWASAGILLQVMSVYFFSAIIKDGEQWRTEFTAVYYTMMLDSYNTPLGRLLLDYPNLMAWLTRWVWWLEQIGPLLAFSPLFMPQLRFAVMVQLMLMHTGFILCMEIGHFPFVSLCSLTLFLGGWFWNHAGQRLEKPPVQLFYDRDCGFCFKSVLLLRLFLALPAHTVIRPAQDDLRADRLMSAHYSWVVVDANDQAHLKWAAFIALLRASPLFSLLAPVLAWRGFTFVGDAVYDFVGRHRGGFGRISAALWPQQPLRFECGRSMQAVAGMFVLLCLLWNLATIHVLPDQTLRVLQPIFRPLRIDQVWNMFAPRPLIDDGWLVVDGTLANGTHINVLHPEAPLSFEKPESLIDYNTNLRWRTFRGRMWEPYYASHRLQYGKYLCRSYNRDKLDDDREQRLLSFDMVWMLESTPKPGGSLHIEPRSVWKHQCFPDPKPKPADTAPPT